MGGEEVSGMENKFSLRKGPVFAMKHVHSKVRGPLKWFFLDLPTVSNNLNYGDLDFDCMLNYQVNFMRCG